MSEPEVLERFVVETYERLTTLYPKDATGEFRHPGDVGECYAVLVLELGRRVLENYPKAKQKVFRGLENARSELKKY